MTIEELKAQISKKVEERNKLITETKAMANAEDADMTEIDKRMADIDAGKVEIDKLNSELETRSKLEELKIDKNKKPEGELRGMKIVSENEKEKVLAEKRAALNKFIHTKGQVRDGLTSADAGVLIPEEIVYQPQQQVKTVYDLKQYVNVAPVTTASGTYPVMAKVADRFNSVTELAANPDLAKPSFSNLQYTISTKRGALPVSQESIDDAQADLIGLINDIISQEELNTNNYFIATVLKSFAAKTAADVDDLKTIVNVDLDQAYNKSVICSASFYNAMDQLKDSQGHYLLNDSLSSATGKTFLGLPLVVVDDTLIGTLAGDKVAFIGDLKRAVLFADRKQVSLEWQNDQIYGQYLVGVLRNDVQKADAAAGFYVTYTVA